MKTTELWARFLSEHSNMEAMANAVIEQLGGVCKYQLEELNSISNGANGYGGFIYYGELTEFWKKHRETIIEDMNNMADIIGEKDAWSLVHSFVPFSSGNHDIEPKDLANALYGNVDNYEDDYLISVLCWYALEEVANRFQDFVYENDVELKKLEEYENA